MKKIEHSLFQLRKNHRKIQRENHNPENVNIDINKKPRHINYKPTKENPPEKVKKSDFLSKLAIYQEYLDKKQAKKEISQEKKQTKRTTHNKVTHESGLNCKERAKQKYKDRIKQARIISEQDNITFDEAIHRIKKEQIENGESSLLIP